MKDIEYSDYDRVENNLFGYFFEKVVRNTKNLEKYFDKKEEGMTKRTIENFKKSINLVNEERGLLAYFKKRKEKGFSNTFSNDSTFSNKKRKSDKDI
jgi:hypothetical protein